MGHPVIGREAGHRRARGHRILLLPVLGVLCCLSAAPAAAQPTTVRQRQPFRATGRAHTAIIGGTNAVQGSWGFMAYVTYFRPGGSGFTCSGTVVSSNVVLTAGHCAADASTGAALDPDDFSVETGSLDVSDTSSGQFSSVARVIVDPAYDPVTASSDAALLVLSKPVSAPTAGLATSADQALAQPGTPALIAGWGQTSESSQTTPAILQWASTVVQPEDYCSYYISFYDPSVHLCTVNAPSFHTGACSGDSGGPLVAADAAGAKVEIGITSEAPVGCGTTTPDLFTAVAPLSDWVKGWTRALTPAAGSQPARTSGRSYMTTSSGRTDVKRTLLGIFGGKFKRAHGYAASCARESAIRISCKVAFTSGSNYYYGRVTVYYDSVTKSTVRWSDKYTMHWVEDRCTSAVRRHCQTYSKNGSG